MSVRHTATERPHQGTGNSTAAIYTRICALFREQHHFSEDTPDRVLLQELYLRPGAIEAVRSSNKPYHYPDNGGSDMDLMNLPFVNLHPVRSVQHRACHSGGRVNMHLDTVYNTWKVRFFLESE